MTEHAYQTNYTVTLKNFKTITTNPYYHQRRCLEALGINSVLTPLNCDDGVPLSEAYFPHISR